jgi:hypothetical protein
MAPETTKTKRKSVYCVWFSGSSLICIIGTDKKVAFADDKPSRPSKKAKTTPNAAEPEDKLPAAKARESRKRAADFFDDTADKSASKEVAGAPVKAKKIKTTKNADVAASLTPKTKEPKTPKVAKEAPAKSKGSNEAISEIEDTKEAPVKSKKVKAVQAPEEFQTAPAKSKKVKIAPAADKEEPIKATFLKPKTAKDVNGEKKVKLESKKVVIKAPEPDNFSSDGEDNIADQTAALLAGFDSSSDEDEEDAVPLDQVPQANISKKARKALEAAKNDTPGTIYVGYALFSTLKFKLYPDLRLITLLQSRSSWLLRAPDARLLLPIRHCPSPSSGP